MNDLKKQDQDDGPYGITVGAQKILQGQIGPADEEFIFQYILRGEAEAQQNDDEHDAPMLPPDIRIDHDGEPQPEQQKKQGEKHGQCIEIQTQNDVSLPSVLWSCRRWYQKICAARGIIHSLPFGKILQAGFRTQRTGNRNLYYSSFKSLSA